MEPKKKRLTLDLDPTFQRRLKGIAALKGVSMRAYCQAAIDRELTKDEAGGLGGCWPGGPTTSCSRRSGRRSSRGHDFPVVPPS